MPRLRNRQERDSAEEFVPANLDKRLSYINDKKTQRQKLLRKRALLSNCINHREGTWTLEQNKIYLKFLQQNTQDFTTEYYRRCRKVFNRLSEFLPQRTSEQCRSHHQKFQKQIGSEDPQLIIEYVKMRIEQRQSKQENKKQKGTQVQKISELTKNGFVMQVHENQLKIVLNLQSIYGW